MQLKQVTPTKVSVGDMEFYIRPFPAFRAANITGELASVLAPLLGVLAPLVSEGGGRKQEASEEEASGAGGKRPGSGCGESGGGHDALSVH